MEKQAVVNYTKQTPFPSYEEMQKDIENYPHQELSICMWAEFGRENHDDLKAIYESGMNPEVIKQRGEAIYERGGFEAMQMNCYAFKLCGPFAKAKDQIVRIVGPSMIEYGWDGIGPWQS